MTEGAKYVVAAYAVVWVVLLFYVIVIASRAQRMSREIELLSRHVGGDVDADVERPLAPEGSAQ